MYQRTDYYCGEYIFTEKRYPRGYAGKPKRNRRRKETPEAMQRENERQRRKKLQRLILANFRIGDFHLTLSYRKDERPESAEEATKRIQGFIRKLRREYRKRGHELKYIYVTEIGKKGSCHHHMLIPNLPDLMELVRRFWTYGHEDYKPLYEDGAFEKLAEYLVKKETKEEITGCTYHPSRNLTKPAERRERINAKCWARDPRPRKGYTIIKESIINGENPVTGYPYQEYIERRNLPPGRKGGRSERSGRV